jgi:hypothetical protein
VKLDWDDAHTDVLSCADTTVEQFNPELHIGRSPPPATPGSPSTHV